MSEFEWNPPDTIDDSEKVHDINELEPGSVVDIILDDGMFSGPVHITGVDEYYVNTISPAGIKGGIDKGKFKRWIAQDRVQFVYHAPSMPSEEVADMMVPDTIPAGWELYYRDSALEHGQDPSSGLDKSDIVTQCAWCQRFQLPGTDDWVDYNPMPGSPVSHGICPEDMAKMMPPGYTPQAKTAQGIPATYSDQDPLDMNNARALVDDLDSQWWTESPDVQRQAIANAFRAALVSPRQNLKWNAIVYQDLLHLGADVADPDVYEQAIRDRKEKWDRFGQQTLDLIHQNADDPEWIDYGPATIEKYMPGIWKNIRNAGIIGPYVEELRQAAMEDVARGGTGQYFRQKLLDLQIPGIGPKIAAFVWLLLCPKTSQLATIDIHMMRALGKDAESPADINQYLQYERELDDRKNQMGYTDVPLGAYQWALWDWQRTPGYHQDHTPLRPLNPVDWRNIDWSPQARVRAKPQPEIPPEQMSLDAPVSAWKLYD
jgi:hypothetical protein